MKDPEKLKRIAKEWGVETEGKDIYTLAHEMAELALMEYGKPFGVSRWLSRAPPSLAPSTARSPHQPGGAEHPHQGLQRGSARGLCLGL